MTDWNTLLALEAGAAATLIGLVFVAVSINLDRVLAYPGLPGRAAESVLQLLEVFLISTVALVPGQPERILAVEFLVIGVFFWVAPITTQIRYLMLKADHPRWWIVLRTMLSQLATVPFCVAGIALLMGAPGALYWLVPGFVFSFVSGVVSSWVLLVEIRR
ncbi:MAG: hypothetical protein ABSG41_07910 [Bryobacteraceae bacterium]|jgi:modulator of FtsH protease